MSFLCRFVTYLLAYYLKNYLLLDWNILINIVIEGPEKSGKSHLMALISKHLREQIATCDRIIFSGICPKQ